MRQALALLPLLAALSACIEIPQASRQPAVRTSSTTANYSVPSPQNRQCLSELGSAQANFTAVPDQYFGAGCSTLGSVRLSSLRSDSSTLTLGNLGPVTCPLANTFAGWARYGVDRAARQILGSRLVRIETALDFPVRK